MTKEEAGLAILGITGASALWSWGNSSIFTIRNFVNNDEARKNAYYGMNLSISLIVLFSLALYFLYGEHGMIPALITFISGLAYYAIYDLELKK